MENKRRFISPTVAIVTLAGCLLLLASNVVASQPKPPEGVPAAATYYPNGKVWVLENDNRQTVWYSNGLKKADGEYRNKQREGQWQFWFENGKLKGEGAFQTNLREGGWKLYTEQGSLNAVGEYRKNRREGVWTFYYSSGKVESRGPYVGGLKNGEWISYYENGQIFYKGNYQNDLAQGDWNYFFQNGQPYQTGKFRNDVRVGDWTICIQPGGPCGKETLRSGQTPRTTHIDLNTLNGDGPQPQGDTSNPKALLESLDTGGVPDEVPSSLPNNWQE